MKRIILVFFILLISFNKFKSQNVGISNSGAVPNASAMLDIVSTDKGLLVPRFALSDITVAAPVTSPAVSLIVYNTATAGTPPNNVVPGFYYWDGSKWVAFAGSGGKDWALLGNAGTVAGTNFLGTTDNVDLVFKVNNIQAGRLTSNTNNNSFFGYEAGLNNSSTFNSFFGSQAGKANTSSGNNVGLGFGAMRNATTGGVNTFVGNNAGANWVTSLANTALGNQALQGLAASTGSCNTAIGFAAGSGYTGTPPGGSANGLSQLSGSYNTYIGYSSSGTTSSNTFTNSTAIGAFSQAGANDALVLGSINGANGATADTKVGIGVTVPTERLHVNGNVRFSNALMPNNNAGTSGQVLVSQGPGVAPVWQAAANILKTYSAFATRTRIPASGSTTAWTDVTGLTKTITTLGPATFIIMTYGSLEVISSAGNAGCEIKIQQNGVDVPNAFQTLDVVDAGGLTGTINHWSFQTVVTVATAGTYTFKVQAHKYNASFDNFYAGGNTTAPAASQNQGALIIQQFDQ